MSETITPEAPANDKPAAEGHVPLPPTPADTTAQPDLCLVPTKTKITRNGVTTEEDKPCQKAKGHTGDHSARKYNKIDTSVVSLDMLKANDDELEEELATGLERVTESAGPKSDVEKKVVADAKASHEAWERIGKPAGFNDSKAAWVRYRCEPDNYPAVRKMVKDMTTYAGFNARVAPIQRLKNGEYRVVWVATDKAPRGPRANAEGQTPATDSTAPATPPAEAPAASAPAPANPPATPPAGTKAESAEAALAAINSIREQRNAPKPQPPSGKASK